MLCIVHSKKIKLHDLNIRKALPQITKDLLNYSYVYLIKECYGMVVVTLVTVLSLNKTYKTIRLLILLYCIYTVRKCYRLHE